VGAGRRAEAGHSLSPARSLPWRARPGFALLLDAAGYWRRVETCGLESTIPVPAGFCGGSPGTQTRTACASAAPSWPGLDRAGTGAAAQIANAPLPYEKSELHHEPGWRGWRSISRHRKKTFLERKTGLEKSVFTAGLLIFRQFQSISSFPLDTEVYRWAAPIYLLLSA